MAKVVMVCGLLCQDTATLNPTGRQVWSYLCSEKGELHVVRLGINAIKGETNLFCSENISLTGLGLSHFPFSLPQDADKTIITKLLRKVSSCIMFPLSLNISVWLSQSPQISPHSQFVLLTMFFSIVMTVPPLWIPMDHDQSS